MKSKERVKRAFHFNHPDRVPMSPTTLKSDFFPVMPNIPRSWQPNEYPPHIKGDLSNFGNFFYKKVYYDWNDEYRKKLGLEKKWWETIKDVINEWGVIWRTSGTSSEDKGCRNLRIASMYYRGNRSFIKWPPLNATVVRW